LRDLTQHLTTRADDGHATPVIEFQKAQSAFAVLLEMSNLGKVLGLPSN
jgi:hypothetical protein